MSFALRNRHFNRLIRNLVNVISRAWSDLDDFFTRSMSGHNCTRIFLEKVFWIIIAYTWWIHFLLKGSRSSWYRETWTGWFDWFQFSVITSWSNYCRMVAIFSQKSEITFVHNFFVKLFKIGPPNGRLSRYWSNKAIF